MSNSDCIFCSIVAGNIPCIRIFEDDAVLAFMDIGPISDGHTLVIPKAHFGRLHECSTEVLAGISNCIGRIAQAVVSAVDAEAYNVLCNNGAAAGQLVEHVHFHIIPRISGDRVFDRWPAHKYKEGQAEEIAARIREKL